MALRIEPRLEALLKRDDVRALLIKLFAIDLLLGLVGLQRRELDLPLAGRLRLYHLVVLEHCQSGSEIGFSGGLWLQLLHRSRVGKERARRKAGHRASARCSTPRDQPIKYHSGA